MLLLAHIDVVPAGDGWQHEPFRLTEADGYFHGRGVIDDKAMAAIFVANLIELHREGFKRERDIIVALTTDEELARSPHNGVQWILDNERALIDAEFALNEGGGGALRNGQPFRFAVQLAEKVYQTYVLEVTDPGGHSASPRRDNPIYRLSAALAQACAVRFPAAAQSGDARQFRAACRDRSAADNRRDQGAARRLDRSRGARAAVEPIPP